MQFNPDNIRLKYHLLFSLTWMLSLIFYPVWIEPTTSQNRSLIYIIAAVWTLINIILFYKFLLKNNIPPLPTKSFSIKPDKLSITLVSLLAINILLHLYPIINFPLIIGGDEAAHAQSGVAIISRFLWMKNLDFDTYFSFIRIIAWISLIFITILFSLNKSRKHSKVNFLADVSKHYMLFFAVLFSISLMLFFLTKDIQYNLMLMRYPPMDKILNTLSISLFGINEFSVRIPQLLFTIFGSILIFKICEENISREAGLISACFYAFSPVVFHFSALAELICGTVLFSILIIYFYLKYVKTDNIGFLFISFYFISLGFLYKRIIIIMIAVLFISILFLKEKRIKFLFLLKLIYFSLVPIVPYIIIGKIFPNNPFGLNFSNWLNPDTAFGYFILLLRQLSYPLFALLVISIIYSLFKRTFLTPVNFVLYVCFITYYLFYTSISIHGQGPFIHGLNRYSMIFYPFVSIISGSFIDKITRSLKWRHSFKTVSSVLIIYLILICTIWQVPPVNARFVTYKNIESRYYPVDKALKWVDKNINDGEKILILRVASATFYRDKYGIRREKIVDFWYNIDKFSTPDKLLAFCKENRISHIMFSYGQKNNAEIVEYMKEHQGGEFSNLAEFNLNGNYIYIYKIKI